MLDCSIDSVHFTARCIFRMVRYGLKRVRRRNLCLIKGVRAVGDCAGVTPCTHGYKNQKHTRLSFERHTEKKKYYSKKSEITATKNLKF